MFIRDAVAEELARFSYADDFGLIGYKFNEFGIDSGSSACADDQNRYLFSVHDIKTLSGINF